jgi:hypothetical protein
LILRNTGPQKARHHEPMAEPAKPVDLQRVPCEVCLKEVPKSEAEMAEARDYVAYFCGLECYDKWRRERAESDMKLKVECYAGYRGEEEPLAFTLGATRFAVIEILDRWLAPGYRYFKVEADDGRTLLLRHDTASGDWQLAGLVGTSAAAKSLHQTRGVQ